MPSGQPTGLERFLAFLIAVACLGFLPTAWQCIILGAWFAFWWRTVLLKPTFLLAIGAFAGLALWLDSATQAAFAFEYAALAAALGLVAWWGSCKVRGTDSFSRHAAWRLRSAWRYRAIYSRKWGKVMGGHGLREVREHKIDLYPRIVRFRASPNVERLLVEPLKGQNAKTRDCAGSFAKDFNALRCTVRRDRRQDRFWLEFLVRDTLTSTVAPIEPAAVPDLEAIPCGVREDGSPWTIRLDQTHTFLGAETGAGKSSAIYSLLLGLGPAIHGGWVQVAAVDPKGGAELGKIEALCRWYEDGSIPEMIDVLRELCDLMDERGRECKRLGVDKAVPSVDMPFILAIFDEAADLFTTKEKDEDGKLWANFALAYMERLLRKGRAFGIHMFVLSQKPNKDTFPFRDLIPTGIALSLKSTDQVKMVLGQGAYELGANCLDLELPRDAGRGYEIRDGSAWGFRVSFVDRQRVAEMCLRYARPSNRLRLQLEGANDPISAEVEEFRREMEREL